MRKNISLWTVFLLILFILFFTVQIFADEYENAYENQTDIVTGKQLDDISDYDNELFTSTDKNLEDNYSYKSSVNSTNLEDIADEMFDTVYLNGKNGIDDEGRGTKDNPVKTFAKAFELVENDGIINMVGDTRWFESDRVAMQNKGSDFKITIDGKGDGNRRYKILYELVGTTPKPIRFATCSGITLTNVESGGTICASGSPLIINGESNLGTVYGGVVFSGSSEVIEGNTSITLESGKVNSIYGGSRDNSVNGNTLINIKGGEITGSIRGGGNGTKTSLVLGDSTVNISGNINFPSHKLEIISADSELGIVKGKKTINITDFDGKVGTICGADYLNLINSKLTASKLKFADKTELIENLNIDENSILTASSGVSGINIRNFSINNQLSGKGKLVLNNDSYLGLKCVDANSKITIQTNKPYIDTKQNSHTLLLSANSEAIEPLDMDCFSLEVTEANSDNYYILKNGDDTNNKNIYIYEPPNVIIVSMTAPTDLVYNGLSKSVTVTVKDGSGNSIDLSDLDYIIKYYNSSNVSVEPLEIVPIDAGTYTAKFCFNNNTEDEIVIGGTITCTYVIEKAEGSASVTCEDIIYGDLVNPVVSSFTNRNENVEYEYKKQGKDDSKYSSVIPKEVGDYTIKATFGETNNYYSVIALANFSIISRVNYIEKRIDELPNHNPGLDCKNSEGEFDNDKFCDHKGRIEILNTEYEKLSQEDRVLINDLKVLKLKEQYNELLKFLGYINKVDNIEVIGIVEKVDIDGVTGENVVIYLTVNEEQPNNELLDEIKNTTKEKPLIVSYDIKLLAKTDSEESLIQPKPGETLIIKIELECDILINTLQLFHINSKDEIIEIKNKYITVEDGKTYLSFEIDSFSYFLIYAQKKENEKDTEEEPEGDTEKDSGGDSKKDPEVDTGGSDDSRRRDNSSDNLKPKTYYTLVYKASEGGIIVGAGIQKVLSNNNASIVKAVPKLGYVFINWSDGITTIDRQDMDISNDMTITAIFEKVVKNRKVATDNSKGIPYYIKNGEDIILSLSALIDGKIRYISPEDKEILFKMNPKTYSDIENHWGKNSILFAAERELFTGFDNSKFDPNGLMTRGMLITVIGRLYNGDISSKTSNFIDAKECVYYTPYISWAEENNIVEGTGNNRFAPDRNVTREEMASIIVRFTKFAGFKISLTTLIQEEFLDDKSISNWAKQDVYYLKRAGILQGKGNNTFDPRGSLTRAEACVILKRLIENILK